jgi:hypothetical protein
VASVAGFSAAEEPAFEPRERLTPNGGVLTECTGVAATRISLVIDFRGARAGAALAATWTLDGTPFADNPSRALRNGTGNFAFKVGNEGIAIIPGEYEVTVRDDAGAVVLRASVTRSCPLPLGIQPLGFASFPSSGALPVDPPSGATRPGGTITGCGSDTRLAIFWREQLPAGQVYRLTVGIPGGAVVEGDVASLGPGQARRDSVSSLSGGVVVPNVNGVYEIFWSSGSYLRWARVTRAC